MSQVQDNQVESINLCQTFKTVHKPNYFADVVTDSSSSDTNTDTDETSSSSDSDSEDSSTDSSSSSDNETDETSSSSDSDNDNDNIQQLPEDKIAAKKIEKEMVKPIVIAPVQKAPERIVPIIPGNELTPDEVVDLCKILDPDEYGKASKRIDPARIEAILKKVQSGGAILDKSEPRFRAGKYEPNDPSRISALELAAVIDIMEGNIPTCAPDVLERAIKKIQSGQYIKLDTGGFLNRGIRNDHGLDKTNKDNKPLPKVAKEERSMFWGLFSFGAKESDETVAHKKDVHDKHKDKKHDNVRNHDHHGLRKRTGEHVKHEDARPLIPPKKVVEEKSSSRCSIM